MEDSSSASGVSHPFDLVRTWATELLPTHEDLGAYVQALGTEPENNPIYLTGERTVCLCGPNFEML